MIRELLQAWDSLSQTLLIIDRIIKVCHKKHPMAESDRWAPEVGDKRWSWEGLLPYFKKSETFIPPKIGNQDKQPRVHGYDGPVTVSHVSSSAGGPRNYPLKSMVEVGHGDYANSTFNGERKWATSCYKRGTKVTLWDNPQAAKLLFSEKKVTGIEVLPNNHSAIRALAKKEVLVSAGDMEMISPEVDWTAGAGSDFLSLQRHDDEKTTALAKKAWIASTGEI
ncbi:hypothetical protein BDZ45DRAFT_698268 [Acephala macrosclerotiorum]|nr:hypothetical protein BDZ45DRAFT_698268 [Acephala macrosclerotiorum]